MTTCLPDAKGNVVGLMDPGVLSSSMSQIPISLDHLSLVGPCDHLSRYSSILWGPQSQECPANSASGSVYSACKTTKWCIKCTYCISNQWLNDTKCDAQLLIAQTLEWYRTELFVTFCKQIEMSVAFTFLCTASADICGRLWWPMESSAAKYHQMKQQTKQER